MDAQTQAEPPKCLICLDDEIELTDIPEAQVCVPCLERAFKLAINDPTSYPVVLGNAILNVDSFEHLLPADVVTAFRASEIMHRTPRLFRLFCAARPHGQTCGRFLGDVRQARPEGTEPTKVFCRPCQAWTCVDCGQECVDSEHRCNTERGQELPANEKGRTWQRCPNQGCQAVATRIDGCNSMICGHCRTSFCWLCGERARHSDSHWWAKCPRFSTHDDADATWDRIPANTIDRREILLIFLRRQYTFYKTNKAELEERLEISIAAKLDEIHKAERENNIDLENKSRIANEYKDLLKQKDMRLVNLRAGEHGIRYLLGNIMDEYFVLAEKREQLRFVNEITGLDIHEDEMGWHDRE
ncbi:hypothetical protein CKM354_001103000 [Cercospora kikuchii]|uniref:RBR-type E3 ubiquitin transferase n=1 Tax=Cercospora kikuchii TaxID=84275 RepID=A0A9P3FL39_9PEZI|nr:uncharacterized protein CKM354_001103000 [Cercospora kikuchii]GIZ47955.1 hypothetical protein CKM354_001103000 [Cercospora kikuchii]